MKAERIARALTHIDPAFIEDAAPKNSAGGRRFRAWWLAAACLFLILAAVPALYSLRPAAERPPQPAEAPSDNESQGGPPSVVVNGTTYMISSYPSHYEDCPAGFVFGGQVESGEFSGAEYYVNPDLPEHIYLYLETQYNGQVNPISGSLEQTEPHMAYMRFADLRIRGKDLISYQGRLYISLWSLARGDADPALLEKTESAYGPMIEGAVPAGFIPVGTADFAGYDTWPAGALSSNEPGLNVWADPENPDILLVATSWFTATAAENGETRHEGFNLYIPYTGK